MNKLEADDLTALTLYAMLVQGAREATIYSCDRFLWIKDEAFRLSLRRGGFEELFLSALHDIAVQF